MLDFDAIGGRIQAHWGDHLQLEGVMLNHRFESGARGDLGAHDLQPMLLLPGIRPRQASHVVDDYRHTRLGGGIQEGAEQRGRLWLIDDTLRSLIKRLQSDLQGA